MVISIFTPIPNLQYKLNYMNSSMKRTSLLASCILFSAVLFAQKDEVPKGWHMMDKEADGFIMA